MLKKVLKKRLSVVSMLAFSLIVTAMPTNQANAAEQVSLRDTDSKVVSPSFVNDFRYVKKNVQTYEEWSSFERVSDNLSTGETGGSISCTETKTFSPSVKGNIYGIDVTIGGSISSTIGYTLNVGTQKRVYMGYRVRYTVETGTREMVDLVTGKVISSNTYTVKNPIYGEYKLINV